MKDSCLSDEIFSEPVIWLSDIEQICMLSKKNKFLAHFYYGVEFLLLQLFLLFARLWPRSAWLRLGEWSGLFLLKIGFYRRIVSKNLRYVGIWSAAEQAQLIRNLYATMGRYAADFLHLREKLPPISILNPHIMKTSPGPFVFFLAHFGNWELLPALVPHDHCHLTVIAKPMKNPFVEKWLLKRRQRWNLRILPPRSVVRKALDSLQEGKSIALLTDQYSAKMGRPAIFMSKETLSIRTAAGLAVKSSCAALSAAALLQKDGSYKIIVDSPEEPQGMENSDADSKIAASLQSHNDLLSKWITKYPEHWFGWFHRRFKDAIQY
jgi:KDO2-lipid IV(A) lauroyltransferase